MPAGNVYAVLSGGGGDIVRRRFGHRIARAYGVGLECTTFYDPNFLPEHPGGIEDYLRTTEGISFKTMHGPFAGLSTGVRDRQIRAVTMAISSPSRSRVFSR